MKRIEKIMFILIGIWAAGMVFSNLFFNMENGIDYVILLIVWVVGLFLIAATGDYLN